jgi:3-methylfumaryl-CoA hydratase
MDAIIRRTGTTHMDRTDTADPKAWIGRTETAHDLIGATPVQALAATLDLEDPMAAVGLPLPPLWHWLFFLPLHQQRDIGPDGHARRGGFLPPVPLPRRMWAGSRFEFRAPLRVGDTVARKSEIEDVRDRTGRSGRLCFVTVRHELHCNGAPEPALVEWHEIVYREATRSTDAEPPRQQTRADAQWQRTINPDVVLLFRYSALTFNGHRIHYDRRHAAEVEGYPGLVVHGPLIATLLMDLLRRHRPDADVASFAFKAVRPAFDDHALTLCGRSDGADVRLWAHDHEGSLVMEATAMLRGN